MKSPEVCRYRLKLSSSSVYGKWGRCRFNSVNVASVANERCNKLVAVKDETTVLGLT